MCVYCIAKPSFPLSLSYPFLLAWQAPVVPFAECLAIVPGYMYGRVIHSLLDRRIRSFGVSPIAVIDRKPPR